MIVATLVLQVHQAVPCIIPGRPALLSVPATPTQMMQVTPHPTPVSGACQGLHTFKTSSHVASPAPLFAGSNTPSIAPTRAKTHKKRLPSTSLSTSIWV